MRSCPKDLHLRILRGGTGWGSDIEYPQDKYMSWIVIILGIIWLVSLIVLSI